MIDKNKDKKLVIRGSKRDVVAIMRKLVEKFGRDATLSEMLEVYGKESIKLSVERDDEILERYRQ